MARAENSGDVVFTLKLLVDKKKNKVVLVEAGKEFVDVLFSFLTLPMGTIVRLLGKYEKNQVSEATKIGCFNNLYKSVLDMGTDNFMTKACKDMLLYPRSLKENQRKRLKVNIDDTETIKYYTCENERYHVSRCHESWRYRYYSNFHSSKCICGSFTTMEFEVSGDVADEEIFVSHKTLFTITDNLKVGFTSITHTLKTLKLSGYSNIGQLLEMNVDVDHEKVLALLQCLFSSETPFTDVFLTEKISLVISKVLNFQSLAFQKGSGGVAQSDKVISVSVFTRKVDKKVLYIESEKDFVDLLFTFLVLPLNSAWKLAGSHHVLGCINNLCDSFDSLSSIEVSNALNKKCKLPWCYSFQQPLLDVSYAECRVFKKFYKGDLCTFKPMDPSCDKLPEAGVCSGFVKRCTTFIVSDDLTITPMDLSSTVCLLKKWNMDFDDIEVHVIDISSAEAIGLLRASFVTTNALNTVFQSLLLKKPKEENV